MDSDYLKWDDPNPCSYKEHLTGDPERGTRTMKPKEESLLVPNRAVETPRKYWMGTEGGKKSLYG